MEESPKQKKKISARLVLLMWVVGLLPLFLLGLMLYFASTSDLPDTVALANPKTNLATEVISSYGKVLGRFYLENLTNINYNQLSPFIIEGLIATADERFYNH